MKNLSSMITSAMCVCAMVALLPLAAGAQPVQYGDPYCGSTQNGVWVANGNCGPGSLTTIARVSGTIIAVKGHLVTLQQSSRQLVINDQPALDMELTGKVAVGRVVEATGYWRSGTFFATSLQDQPGSK